jgi:hypothetical protein
MSRYSRSNFEVDAMLVEMLVLHSNNETSCWNQRMRLTLLLEESKKFYVKSFKAGVASRDEKPCLISQDFNQGHVWEGSRHSSSRRCWKAQGNEYCCNSSHYGSSKSSGPSSLLFTRASSLF